MCEWRGNNTPKRKGVSVRVKGEGFRGEGDKLRVGVKEGNFGDVVTDHITQCNVGKERE
jgi:hypothetical protein